MMNNLTFLSGQPQEKTNCTNFTLLWFMREQEQNPGIIIISSRKKKHGINLMTNLFNKSPKKRHWITISVDSMNPFNSMRNK